MNYIVIWYNNEDYMECQLFWDYEKAEKYALVVRKYCNSKITICERIEDNSNTLPCYAEINCIDMEV